MTQSTQSQSVYEWGIGDRLRKAREHTGLGQKAFGDAIGISRNSVSTYESGKKPRQIVLNAWATYTGV